MATMNGLGFALLRQWEGCRLYAYDDFDDRRVKTGEKIIGTLTIGYGHTGKDVIPEHDWTQEKADEALEQDVGFFAHRMAPLVTGPLSDNQFSAFVCLAYNIGLHAFSGSSALHLANTSQFKVVPDHIMLWDKTTIRGVQTELPGLRNRRHAEVLLWNT
jgi:lysozyme